MTTYELALLVDPDVKLEDQKSLIEKIKKLITTAEGKVEKVAEQGRIELATPLKKKNAAMLTIFTFGYPSGIGILDKKLKVENQLMRYLLVKKDLRRGNGIKVAQ